MTLARLVLAWAPVAVLFVIVGGLGARFESPSAMLSTDEWTKLASWRSLEAAAVTLFASLWFDSLGHGGWWLLFALLGLIVSMAQLPGSTTSSDSPPQGAGRQREALLRAARDVVRYLVAGALLAWRLG